MQAGENSMDYDLRADAARVSTRNDPLLRSDTPTLTSLKLLPSTTTI